MDGSRGSLRSAGCEQRAILQGEGANWLHGHHYNKAGVAYYGADGRRTVTPNYDWVVLCASNAGDQFVNEWTSSCA